MRFLLSTVAATALMATPALAQQADTAIENDLAESPTATDQFGAVGFDQLEQDLSAAGFSDANELRGAEIYHSTYQGQQALIIIMDEQFDDVAALDDPIGDEFEDDVAAAPDVDGELEDLAESPDIDDPATDDLAETPADPAMPQDDLAESPEIDDPATDDLAEAPADPAMPQDDLAESPEIDDPVTDDLAEAPADPAMPQDDLAESPDIGDPDVTATVPGVGVEDDLSQAGFMDAQRSMDGQVFRTSTEDGRTMLIVLSQDFGTGPGLEPGVTGATPEIDPGAPEPGVTPDTPDMEELEGEAQ